MDRPFNSIVVRSASRTESLVDMALAAIALAETVL